MIDVNKLLNSVLTAGGQPDRQLPVPRSGSVPAVTGGGVPQAGGFGQGGGGIGDFLSGNIGTLGAGALAGGLAGTLLSSKHTRKLAGTALQVGAAAVLGGLAYKAYQNYRSGQPIVPPSVTDMLDGMRRQGGGPQGQPSSQAATSHGYEGFLSRSQTPPQTDPMLLLRAMIAATMADGRVDEKERALLIDRVEASGFSAEERAYLEGLIARPETTAQLAAQATHPEAAAQVYLAAYVAIDADTPQEKAWLDDLADRLRLDPALRRNVEEAAAAAEAAANGATTG